MKEEDQEKKKNQLSRRGFLKGAGLTTAGTVMANSGLMAIDVKFGPARGESYGPDATRINLNVNGQIFPIICEPRTTLSTALRDHIGMTGTKVVCDRGSCSACTVWLDGKPVNSCMTMAMDVGDQKITTVEGLAQGEELHPIQQAFIDHDASQCGYCTPGMLMSCAHLLKENPNPSLDDVKKATRGNLCRCGTYPHVFTATLDAADKMK